MINSVKTTHNVIPALLFAFIAMTLTSFARAESPDTAAEQALPEVRVVTSEGAFTLQLRPDVAPETVDNFLEYVNSGFYDGTVFHRVIPGFMVQGGGFTGDMSRKTTRDPIRNEATRSLPNLRGTISMARTNAPHSATSQFFINVANNGFLDAGVRGAGYAVFGKVTEGMGVIDAIASKKTGMSNGMADVPVNTITIESMSVLDLDLDPDA
ncbi:peptidyl-prolyl cis-trans isomerase [Marinobacter salinexigens]|uniref:Peptidyl-prolyl cis-trans isomerase n=1 Tax=Marinobacter salinexigens TaxID=2919747 RepID=A0A5B0VHN1_9GAMM|nr:peptidylprolyl isomerase [Marinobacter salinexigens]KAA1173924.1 peptidyl-prolyl cis-trans isomerase [Marinobacter salinexigens]